MAEIVLVTGGSRSGKSRYAMERAEQAGKSRLFVATALRTDAEMELRILRHQAERRGRGWRTAEEAVDLAGLLREAEEEIVLVDCLTLWINNLMYEADQQGREMGEDEMAETCARLLEVCASRPGMVFFVTNEVGLGIVPDNPLARRYRDLVGRCNQVMAEGADQVFFLVSGLPLQLK